jgi:chromosome segregation protein
MVRETASEAQMLIVTHNKKTMELASRMYGVTMQEPGVSSIISAALDATEIHELVPEREEAVVAG